MRKLSIVIAIVLGMGISTSAQISNYQGGLFSYGPEPREYNNRRNNEAYAPLFLPEHGQNDNLGAEPAPLGSGIAVLIGLGAAYLVGKKRKE